MQKVYFTCCGVEPLIKEGFHFRVGQYRFKTDRYTLGWAGYILQHAHVALGSVGTFVGPVQRSTTSIQAPKVDHFRVGPNRLL